jgi:uncharacterized Ntn-hydrolase superfamily protein
VTFSIVAADLAAGEWGVAVASKFPAVGAVVPWARAGEGAVATQSHANTSFGPEGLELMGRGMSSEKAMKRLLDHDDGREQRQVGMVDRDGKPASFTGGGCMEWAGGASGDGYACQGNILAGEHVVTAMSEAFAGTEGDLVDRLLAALLAGDEAGGDRRGRQSAALLVVRDRGGYGGYDDRYVDLRVDDHPEAPAELARIFQSYDRAVLIRDDALVEASHDIVLDLQLRLAALGRFEAPRSGRFDDPTREALAAFAGEFNLEGKLRDDNLVYESLLGELRDLTPELAPPHAIRSRAPGRSGP